MGCMAQYDEVIRQEEMVFGDIKEGELQEAVVDGIRYAYATGETTASVIHDDSYQGLTAVTIPGAPKASDFTTTAFLYYSFSSNKSVSSSQALMREPATVSFTSYHFPVSTLPGRVTNRFLLSPIVCSIACCVLPSQPKFSQQ